MVMSPLRIPIFFKCRENFYKRYVVTCKRPSFIRKLPQMHHDIGGEEQQKKNKLQNQEGFYSAVMQVAIIDFVSLIRFHNNGCRANPTYRYTHIRNSDFHDCDAFASGYISYFLKEHPNPFFIAVLALSFILSSRRPSSVWLYGLLIIFKIFIPNLFICYARKIFYIISPR